MDMIPQGGLTMKKSNIGGQAVLEGVMMKSPKRIAIAVRKQNNEIEVRREEVSSVSDKYKILKFPVLRGIINFVEIMMLGVRTLTASAEMYGEGLEDPEDYKPSKFESYIAEKTGKNAEDIMITFAVMLAFGFAVLLFIVLPSLAANFAKRYFGSAIVMNLIEGMIRIAIFLIYLASITRMKDIQRVFQYHGAEHKVVHCYEHEKELTVENARQFTTLHPRCGTSFLLLVMIVSILVFSLLGWNRFWWIRILSRILLLPVVAGIAYEVLKWAGKGDSRAVAVISWPGLMLQKLTTREPDDSMLEVAIVAFKNAAFDEPLDSLHEKEEVPDGQGNDQGDVAQDNRELQQKSDNGCSPGCGMADELCSEDGSPADENESHENHNSGGKGKISQVG